MALSQQIKTQIQQAWNKLDREIGFILRGNFQSENYTKFSDFYKEMSSLNPLIIYAEEQVEEKELCLEIQIDEKSTGINFQAIPMGHELSSFVLAPLVALQKAQLPDETTQLRIKNLKGPIELTSYISLTCENCPTVVQSLNMMAALNPHVQHTMVDGSLYPEKMKSLNVLSVPTVHLNGESFVTGRQDMSDLLNKLEEEVGVDESKENLEKKYDVVVVGSGPAGSSAAIYTARKGLKTAIVTENVGGLVKETKGIENLISTPFIEGPELADKLNKHLREYPIDIYENQSVKRLEDNNGKVLELKGGLSLSAPVLIAATGAKWKELNIPGEKEYLGRGVAFCPHCDGPFYKGKRIAVIGGGNSGVEAALDLAGICDKVTLIERGEFVKADKVLTDKLEASNKIDVILNATMNEIHGDDKTVNALTYRDKKTQSLQRLEIAGIFIQIGLVPNSKWIENHVETTSYGEIVIDERGATKTQGIFAAGDVTTVPYKQIVVAMGEGAKAGLSAFDHILKSSSSEVT